MPFSMTVATIVESAYYNENGKFSQFSCTGDNIGTEIEQCTYVHREMVYYPTSVGLQRADYTLLTQCLLVAADIRWNIDTSTLSRICTTLYRNLFHRSSELEAQHNFSL